MPRVELQGLAGRFGGMAKLEEEPPVGWLLEGWLAARELSVVYGQGGTFKSYLALGWTMQLALRNNSTVYIAAEGASGLRSRVEAWMAARGRAEQLRHWHYYNAAVHLDQRDAGMWVNALRSYFKEQPTGLGLRPRTPKLVVVDTLARNFSGDESSPKDMGQFIDGCEYLRRELQCAVLVVHHMGVSTGRERGTSALRNASFAMFKTSDPHYSNLGGGSVKVECDRMKDAPLPDQVRVYFDTVALDADETGDVYRMSQAMRLFPPPPGKQKPRKEVIEA